MTLGFHIDSLLAICMFRCAFLVEFYVMDFGQIYLSSNLKIITVRSYAG